MNLIQFKKEVNDGKKFKISRAGFKDSFNLFEYQQEIAWAISNVKDWQLTDEMGLGKTAEAVAGSLNAYEEEKVDRILVVALSSLLGQWQDAYAKFSYLNTLKIEGTIDQRKAAYQKLLKDKKGKIQVVITSYSTLAIDLATYQHFDFQMGIFDESDYFKSPESRAFKAVKYLSQRLNTIILMSGTPTTGKLEDSFAAIEILSRGKITYRKLEQTYCKKEERSMPVFDKVTGNQRNVKTWVITGYQHIDNFKKIFNYFSYGRTQEDCGIKLPKLNYTEVFLDKYPEFKKAELQIIKGFFKPTDKKSFKINSLQKVNYLHRLCHSYDTVYEDEEQENDPKFLKTLEILNKYKEDQIVIFCNYKNLFNRIYSYLRNKNYGVSRVSGDIVGTSRAREIKKFQEGENQYCLITMAGYAGCDFWNCKIMIKLDIIYNKAKDKQINARITRKNSINPESFIYHIFYKDSMEDVTRSMLSHREEVMDFLEDENSINLNKEVILELGKKSGIPLEELKTLIQ